MYAGFGFVGVVLLFCGVRGGRLQPPGDVAKRVAERVLADRRAVETPPRLDPDLVEVAKGYMGHERGTLEAVTAARSWAAQTAGQAAAANPADPQCARGDGGQAEGALSATLGPLLRAVLESYPDLKANQTIDAARPRSSRRPRTGSRSRARRSTTQ